jgi:hypothetical protein
MMLHHNLNAGAGSASARSSLERDAKQANEGRKAPPNGYARILGHGEHRQGMAIVSSAIVVHAPREAQRDGNE